MARRSALPIKVCYFGRNVGHGVDSALSDYIAGDPSTVNPRRKALLALGMVALAAPLAPFAQQRAKVHRVGWLLTGPIGSDQEFIDDTKKVLRDLGYVEGKNISFEVRSADGRPESLAGAAVDLVALKPDVIVSGATPGTRAAKQATTTIPIVMIGVADPVGAGFVASLARPGGNITGEVNLGLDTAAKLLEMLHAVVPKATRIAVLASDNPAIPPVVSKIVEAGTGLGLVVLPMTVTTRDEIDRAFAAMAREKVHALVVISDRITFVHRQHIAALAAETKLPAIYQYAAQVEAGGLLSYGPNPRNLHKVVAAYIDKILKGARPGDLPVQQPTEFELAINMKTARALGITFPPEILLRADTVID